MAWTIADIWEAVAKAQPEQPALIQGERVVTWAEFDARSDALAAHFIAKGLGHQAKMAATRSVTHCRDTSPMVGAASTLPMSTTFSALKIPSASSASRGKNGLNGISDSPAMIRRSQSGQAVVQVGLADTAHYLQGRGPCAESPLCSSSSLAGSLFLLPAVAALGVPVLSRRDGRPDSIFQRRLWHVQHQLQELKRLALRAIHDRHFGSRWKGHRGLFC